MMIRIGHLWVFVLGTMALLFAVASATAVYAAPEPPYFQRFDVEIEIQPNGDFVVSENQTVMFGPKSASHGFRAIPMDRVEKIVDVSVSEPGRPFQQKQGQGQSSSGTPSTFQVDQEDRNLRIDWWFPRTANASRSFVVRYRVVGGLYYYPGGDQLYWKAVYADRPLPVETSRVEVRFPADLPPDQVKMAFYPERVDARAALLNPRTVRFDARNLPSETGLEVRVQFPHGLVSGEPSSWQAGADRMTWFNETIKPLLNIFLGVMALLILLLGPLWIVLRWYSLGRDPEIGRVPRTLSEPPGDLPPGVVGTLVDQRADVRDVVATLVDMARRGLLRIVEEAPAKGSKHKRKFRLEKLREEPELREFEHLMFRYLFPGVKWVQFDKLKERFRQVIPPVQDQLYKDVVRAGLFHENPKSVRNRYLILGGIAAGVGFGVFMFALPFIDVLEMGWAPFFALGIVGLVQLVAASFMPRRTRAGSLEATRWRAFARYLKEHQPREELTSQLDRFDPYLPYAIALGAEKDWVRKFSEAGAPAPEWYESYPVPGRGWGPRAYPLGDAPGEDGGHGQGEVATGDGGGLQQLSDAGAFSLQNLSDGLVEMLNTASSSISSGGSGGGGGWSGGGSGGGGGGGGGSGGFN